MMNKRGAITDWFYILAILFMISIVLIVSTLIVTTTIDTKIFDDDPVATKAINTTKSTLLNFDNSLLFVIVGLSLFVLVSSAMVFNHPGYFIVGMFLLFIAVVVAAITSNTFWTFSNASTIAATSALFPKMTFLMNKLPFYVAFMGVASAIVAYVAYSKQ